MVANNKQHTQDDNGKNISNRSSSNKGFASMDSEKQREAASKGGKASHGSGSSHQSDSKTEKGVSPKGGQSRGK